ncbi:MAG TPA: HTH domain-containing protein [Polyangiaceae bacterium]|nr:HTH domain-containing protein [Polyangiaceae bacterium]
MTFIEAAAEVLRQAGKPLHYKEITELAIASNLLSHVGKTPEVTMSHRLTSAIKKDDKDVPIVKIKPGVFALREWEDRKGRKAGASVPAPEALEEAPGEDADVDVNALEIEAALRGAEDADDELGESDQDGEPAADRDTPVSGDEALRADLAASGAELFDDEEDDDQPILAPPSPAGAAPAAQQGEGGRRRRRRRRRGRGGQGEVQASGFAPPSSGEPKFSTNRAGDASQPRLEGAPVVNVDGEAGGEPREPFASARPVVRDRQQIMAGGQPTGIELPLGEGDELSGRDLADAAAIVLSSFDRNAGPVPVRNVADALVRRGRLQGEPTLVVAQTSASMRADNLRRAAVAQRPRFRFATGARVALTDWGLGGELMRLEQELTGALERYREAARRALLRRLQELPGHALIELVLLALERTGMTGVRAVRRAGSPGGEAHFAAVHKGGGDSVPTAIVVRKDGREIGRERVTDLRGALHHYGPASAGWLVTTGQVLSGAREEAIAPGAPPVALYDGIALCKLLEDFDVAVVKTRFSVGIPDLELLEALRG